MRLNRLLIAAALATALWASPAALADSALGVPVTGIGSTTQSVPNCPALEGQVCYNAGTGQTIFFIPLNSSTSGVYGVTAVSGGTAGTFADVGSGTSNALTIYLLFSPVNLPVSGATLTFSFIDLDLVGVNDPAYFFETVQFFSAGGSALTPLITSNGQTGSSPLAFVVSGNSTSQTILFGDVTSILNDPFYVALTFGSSWNNTGKNTPEKMTALLTTTPVPEPATLLLFGTGLMAAGLQGYRARRRRHSNS